MCQNHCEHAKTDPLSIKFVQNDIHICIFRLWISKRRTGNILFLMTRKKLVNKRPQSLNLSVKEACVLRCLDNKNNRNASCCGVRLAVKIKCLQVDPPEHQDGRFALSPSPCLWWRDVFLPLALFRSFKTGRLSPWTWRSPFGIGGHQGFLILKS